MRKPFKQDFRLTQGWGVNESSYRRFGLKGHNGTDWALPTGTEVLAPHNGKVLEVADEGGDGYGKYIKIESATEGSLVAHLKSSSVRVGQEVKEGDLLGLSNNTGNSTGPHLHWGYFRIPRNRQDGFGGYIDPFPYIKAVSPEKSVTLDSATFEMLVTKATERDDVLLPKITQLEKDILEVKTHRDESDKAIITLNSKISALNEAMGQDAVNDKDILLHAKELEEQKDLANGELAGISFNLGIHQYDYKAVLGAIESLRKPKEEIIRYYDPILNEFWKNLIKGRKTKSILDKFWNWIR